MKYVDDYATNLRQEIVNVANEYDIEVQLTQYSLNDPDSMRIVADYVKVNKLYTTIIISHNKDIRSLFTHFNDTGNCN